MRNNKRTISNAVYLFGTSCVLFLVAITIFSDYALRATVHGLLSLPLSPFQELLVQLTKNSGPPPYGILYIHRYTPFVLAVGTLPMIIACVFFYKLNNISKSRYKLWKFNLIFLPAYICVVNLWIALFTIMTLS